MKLAILVVASGLALATAPAFAQKQPLDQSGGGESVTKVSTDLIGSLLDEHDLQYEVTTDSYGDPTINVTVGKTVPARGMSVIYYECDHETGQCEDALLWSWFSFPNASDEAGNLAKVNTWNQQNRWTRAYVDEDKDAVLEMDLNATGGIGVENLGVMVSTYLNAVTAFEKTLR